MFCSLYIHLFETAIFISPGRTNANARRIDKSTESSPVMIISSVQGIIFPLELFPRFVLHRARELAFLLSLYFFIPSFLFSLRFKVVIFSRPPFFQPVPRFASLLIFFFGRSYAFVFEVQGLPPLLEYFLPISSSCTLEFFTHGAPLVLSAYFPSFAHVPFSRRSPIDLPAHFLTFGDKFRYFPFPFRRISLDRARLPMVFHFQLLPARELHPGYIPPLNNRRFSRSVSLSLSRLRVLPFSVSFPADYSLGYLRYQSLPCISLSRACFSHQELGSSLSSSARPLLFHLPLGVSSLTRRALQAPQSYLVIQLFDVDERKASILSRCRYEPFLCRPRAIIVASDRYKVNAKSVVNLVVSPAALSSPSLERHVFTLVFSKMSAR